MVWQVTAERYSVEQRVQHINIYFQNQCFVRKTFSALRDFYPCRNGPADLTIPLLVGENVSIRFR